MCPMSLADGLKIETSLLGRPHEIAYRIGKSGHGVTAITLNDQALALDFEANPHRRGAARVSRASWTAALKGGRNVVRIQVGA